MGWNGDSGGPGALEGHTQLARGRRRGGWRGQTPKNRFKVFHNALFRM